MIDIDAKYLVIVKNILAKHVADYEVWVFGSRIVGKSKKYSDLDLVIITDQPLPLLTLALLKEDFSNSDLPIRVDIVDWSSLSDEFKQIILKHYEVLQ